MAEEYLFLLLPWCGIDAMPPKYRAAQSSCVNLILRVFLMAGLVSVPLLAVGHAAQLPLEIELGRQKGNVFELVLNFLRHFSLKVVVATILYNTFLKRKKLSSLAAEVIQFWHSSIDTHEIVSEKQRDRMKKRHMFRHVLIYRCLPLLFVTGSHAVTYLSLWGYTYTRDPDKPPMFVPNAYGILLPVPIRVILSFWDIYTYTVYIYGGRLALATLASFMCHTLLTGVLRLNEELRQLIKEVKTSRLERRSSSMVTSKTDVTNPYIRETSFKAESDRIIEIFRQLQRLRSLHDRLNELLSFPLFLSVGQDFLMNVNDVAAISVGQAHLPEGDIVRVFYIMNYVYSIVPIVMLYFSGAVLSDRSAITLDLIRHFNLILQIKVLATNWKLTGNESHQPISTLFSNGGIPEVSDGDQNDTTYGCNAGANGHLARADISTIPTRKRLNTIVASHKWNFVPSKSNASVEFIPVRLSHYTHIGLNLCGLIRINPAFILNFLASMVTFTVMLIQLLPAQDLHYVSVSNKS